MGQDSITLTCNQNSMQLSTAGSQPPVTCTLPPGGVVLRPGARNRTEIMLVLETSRRTNVAHPNDSVVSNQETPRNQFPDFEGSPWLTFPLLARETLGLEARRRA